MTVQAMGQRPIKEYMLQLLSDVIASRAYNGIVSIHIMLLSENSVCGLMSHIVGRHIVGRLRCQDLRVELASDVTASGEYGVAVSAHIMQCDVHSEYSKSGLLGTLHYLPDHGIYLQSRF